jgi:predicted MPP superfamily phosphohydrolase
MPVLAKIIVPNPNEQTLNFNFIAAGDFRCTKEAVKTIQGMMNKEPELVIALGDLAYKKKPDCWFNIISPLANNDRFRISFGAHDVSRGIDAYNLYLDYFNLTKPYYSFDYGNVHFLTMATPKNKFIPYNDTSEQYKFVKRDLTDAGENKNIDWIIVYTFRSFYSSNTTHPGLDELQDAYHPFFDKYDVDVVLQAHNHNYQRTYPLSYNYTKQFTPIVTERNDQYYTDVEDGQIFLTVGTGGKELYNFAGRAHYVAKQLVHHGFLNIDDTEDGTNLAGTFYGEAGGKIMDEFAIKKNLDKD